uniref:Uncharacterized protein n=1 Tax=Tanacetum cinerariifolium TaxID=118510 RepID=A0A699HDL5_TANCI|nr:hypothetical protein [Tanacetum cinerariifolium]
MKEREVQAIHEIEKWLKEREIQQQESLVTKGTTMEANLSTDGTPLDASSVTKADIKPSYDSVIISEVHHNTFENVFAHWIQNYEQREYIPNTYMVNDNNSNIISDIPNMGLNRGKEEHDYVDYEQQHALFASLINNLKCDVEKCNKVNREAQQANALLINELERYKEKEKHFSKDKKVESQYCKKIKLLNDDISNLKSQACQNDKTFSKENGKCDEYVQSLLKRKNEQEMKNQEFLKQLYDRDKKLQKVGQTDQTLCMLLPKEDNVNTGKHGLGFGNQYDVVNQSY